MKRSTVSISRCADYDDAAVDRAVTEALGRIGGMGNFVAPGSRVLVKPNLLSSRPPEHAVTTHPAVLKAVLRQVIAAGAKPSVGDSPSVHKCGIETLWKNTGTLAVCEELGVPLVKFERGGIQHKRGKVTVWLTDCLKDFDVVVSVPKLKTHSLTIMTGAVKNLFGLVPGYAKTNYHRLYAHPVDISAVFVEIQAIVRPVLHVMDAIVGMQGNGPSGGYPCKLGFVAAGADPVAMDAVCADIIGISRPAEKISMLSQAVEKGLGVADRGLIDVVGADIDSLRPDKFVLPETAHFRLMPRWVSPIVARLLWIRPEFTEACGGCGLCVKSCPVEAIVMSEGRPRFKGGKCIECLCCQEVCPSRAISIKFSRIAKFIMR